METDEFAIDLLSAQKKLMRKKQKKLWKFFPIFINEKEVKNYLDYFQQYINLRTINKEYIKKIIV